jgi:hypothetical protein
MNKRHIASVILLFLLATPGFAQVINASLSGTVSDTSGALIPGVEITATQTGTGVVSTILTNESGTYRFASLQPGPYKVSAALPGFQSQSVQLALGTSQQIRQNFTLQVGTVAQEVQVSVAADELLTAVSSSVGKVLPEKQVVDLPLVGRNVLDFATLMPGVVGTGSDGRGLGSGATFAGISAGGSGNVNVQLDGVTVNNGRHTIGLSAATSINPDLVEEIRVVVAAVDVEGRGSAQLQIRTRSGTNQFHGAGVWNARNSALNANSWSNNRQGIEPFWYNRHQFTASLGGPIVRNKTFFFGLFDGQTGLQKENIETAVLTDTARQGIFRFFPGVNNGHAETTVSGSGNTRIAPVVDPLGNPLDWTRITGATGPMRSFSVFGDATNPGDPFRTRMDPTGFMTKLIQSMPRANAFNGGDGCTAATPCDGLNMATHRWVRRTIGGDGGSAGTNVDEFRRRTFNIKVDHNFNSNHKLTGSYVHEYRYSDNTAQASPWPTGWNGELITEPRVMSAQLTSTLTPAVLNEFRFGYRRTLRRDKIALHHTDPEVQKAAQSFMTVINGMPVFQHPTLFNDTMVVCTGGCSERGDKSPLTTYTNTLSWTKNAHALKFGGEFRYANSFAWAPQNVIPQVYGGTGGVPVRGIDTIAGLLPANITLAQDLLLSLSGSVDRIVQRFEIQEPTDTRFLDYRGTYLHPEDPLQSYGTIHDWHQNEINFFAKDDWKVTRNLTLNLGVRYDLMRVPFMLSRNGEPFTPGLKGGNSALFGYSGRSFADWMSGGGPQKGDLTQTLLIGQGTSSPNQGIWPSDRNNFSPAIGFAWSPGWWGQDKTTIRGGYQIAYQLPGNSFSWIDSDAGLLPGFFYQPTDSGDGTFRNFANMVIPLPVNLEPFEIIPVTQRAQSVSLHDPNYTTPYVQNFTLGVTRSLASNLTLDVRYIGTRGVKLHSQGFNLNDADFRNNGLFQALEVTRAGGNAELFDRMLRGLNIGSGVVGTAITGSEALRRHASFRTIIANGDFAAVARLLNSTNIGTVQPPLTNGGLLRSSGLFPENFIAANPQFSTISYRTNSESSNYHSLQTQVTLRPTRGINYQATYTWSRSLGEVSTNVRDLLDRRADYGLLTSNRSHDFRSFGTFDLPFGPGRLLGGNSSGWLARAIEGWKIGTIFNMTSGAPLNVVARNTLYASGTPDILGQFPRSGEVVWPLNTGDIFGNFFPQQYQRVADPACSSVASNLTVWCTNTALADANGNIVLRNARPGEPGTLGLRTIEGPGRWDLNANIQKSIRIHESKNLTFRMDAQNIFNHPTPDNPNLNVNTGNFGQISTKNGNRTLQAQIRLDF